MAKPSGLLAAAGSDTMLITRITISVSAMNVRFEVGYVQTLKGSNNRFHHIMDHLLGSLHYAGHVGGKFFDGMDEVLYVDNPESRCESRK